MLSFWDLTCPYMLWLMRHLIQSTSNFNYRNTCQALYFHFSFFISNKSLSELIFDGKRRRMESEKGIFVLGLAASKAKFTICTLHVSVPVTRWVILSGSTRQWQVELMYCKQPLPKRWAISCYFFGFTKPLTAYIVSSGGCGHDPTDPNTLINFCIFQKWV